MNSLATTGRDVAVAPLYEEFDFSDLRIFDRIPDNRDIDVVAMLGMAVVYDRRAYQIEGPVFGSFYVRESQRAPSLMSWTAWLAAEAERREGAGPFSPLTIHREVVQVVKHRSGPALRLATGGIDGPYQDWAFGHDLVGKVIGIYLPGGVA